MDETVNTQAPEEKEAKLFTSEQVNEIIRKRLKDYKGGKEFTARIAEVERREQELTQREARLSAEIYLREKGYPLDLLDVIDVNDYDAFVEKAESVNALIKKQIDEIPKYPSLDGVGGDPIFDQNPDIVAAAFSRTAQHEPKEFNW